MIFENSNIELAETHKYIVSDSHLLLKTFESGKKNWVYVAKTITL